MLNSHYKDILSILSEKKAKFLLVGAYAMALIQCIILLK